jgi:hypothetical protein
MPVPVIQNFEGDNPPPIRLCPSSSCPIVPFSPPTAARPKQQVELVQRKGLEVAMPARAKIGRGKLFMMAGGSKYSCFYVMAEKTALSLLRIVLQVRQFFGNETWHYKAHFVDSQTQVTHFVINIEISFEGFTTPYLPRLTQNKDICITYNAMSILR